MSELSRTGQVSLSVRLVTEPSKTADFLVAFAPVIAGARADEPGCLSYQLSVDAEQPNVFYVHEVYRDEAALAAHRESAHFVAWSSVADGILRADGGRTLWAGRGLDFTETKGS